ncbi:hypothetical protein KCU99_g9369, partial [Aureobasidium melanogenum]
MVVLAASICTRGGKAVLSRQFREMQRSRIEALLASLPKLADSGTQHTTVEQDNVRFVYQPLDELYMVLITNRQSNILQDIDSLHLFAQVVTSICRSLDEREILRNAFELLSAFDELVTLGYRENLTLSQIKTFLDMESHEERIQDIISRNKELEATEERKRKAKQLEMQRKEATRSGRSNMPSAPSYPTYTPPPTQPAVTDTYDSYNAEKNKSFQKSLPARSKGMQLGKKTKTTSMFEQVRGDLGPEAEAPLVPSAPAASAPVQAAAPVVSSDREGLHITVAETISAKLSREGSLESFEVKGDLQLRITDPSLTQVQLALALGDTHGAQLNSHPKVDKAAFKNDKIIQLTDTSKGFPANNSIGVMRWRLAAKAEDISDPPITFTAWVNETGSGTYNITLEYELTGGDALNDVTVSIPYQTSEPSVSSFDAVYEVSGDSIDWTIGDVDDANATGSFEFEAQAESEAEFFPMSVRFSKTRPYVEVDVSSVTLLNMGQDISFSKDIKSTADGYMVVFKPYWQEWMRSIVFHCIVTQDEVIEVYRIGGQRAFVVKRKSPSTTIVGLEWIRDGKCLAVALNTGFVDIVSGETGKIIRHGGDDPFNIDAANPKSKVDRGEITCLGWGTVLTRDTIDLKKPSKLAVDQSIISDLWSRLGLNPADEPPASDEDDLETQGQEALLKDLPRQLSFLDVESILPRLSPIPTRHTASGRYDMFATQAALDDYFDSMQRKDRLTADVMFVGHAGGRNRVTVDDILEIKYTPDFPGSGIESPMEEDDETPHSLVPLMYKSHRRSKYHALLRAERDDEATDGPNQGFKNLHISLFDIPLMSSGGSHLHLIVSRTAQLRDLCGYISCSIVSAKSDWTTHTNLPSRFMENVNETLEEKGEGALEDNLYHLAMTGNFTPTMLEWLRDELAERGHKRWDHAMTTLYTELSKILHTNMLPVLERSMVVATNLRGLARYYSDTPHFDVPPEAFTSILSTLSSLQLLVHEAVQILGIEQRQFRAFSRWLRHQIDLAAADPESLSAKDMAERETPQLDLPNTLAYLEGGLTKSRLKPIVFSTPEVDASQQPTTKDLITSIHTSRTNLQDFETQTLLSLHLWSEHLTAVCKSAHQHISLWHQSSRPKTLDISCRTSTTASILPYLDILMLETSADVFETFVLGVPAQPTHRPHTEVCELALWTHTRPANGEPSNTWQQILLPSSSTTPSTISALKFLDEETFLCLFCHEEVHYLLCLPYRCSSSSATSKDVKNQWQTIDELQQQGHIAHTFEASWIPRYLTANGKKGRRNCVVVEQGKKKWKTFDLEGYRSARLSGGQDEVEESMVFD